MFYNPEPPPLHSLILHAILQHLSPGYRYSPILNSGANQPGQRVLGGRLPVSPSQPAQPYPALTTLPPPAGFGAPQNQPAQQLPGANITSIPFQQSPGLLPRQRTI